MKALKTMSKSKNASCEDCCFLGRLAPFCGVCMVKILEEMEEAKGEHNDGNRQNSIKSNE